MTISDRARVRDIPERERSIAEQYRIAADEWAEADAAYYALDNMRTALIADLVLKQVESGTPVSRAEHIARASQEHRDHVSKTADLKRRANKARGRMESLKMQFSVWNSQDANNRQQYRMMRQST